MAKYETYRREDGLWDYRVFATNGEQVAESSQGFTSKSDAERGFAALLRAITDIMSQR